MTLRKRIINYLPYLLVLLLVVLPFIAGADEPGYFESGIKKLLWTFVNNIFGFLIGAAGLLLDYAVNHYVIGFGDEWKSGVGGAIDMSWKIVRDVFNMTFIFGLVWLGFKMILNSGDSSTRKTLITLIMAALLVNFSLFATKFVVDFTNILATEVAKAFVVTTPEGESNPIAGMADGETSISSSFMQLFGLSSVWDANPFNNSTIGVENYSYMYSFGTAIIFLIGAFTFAAGGIMLIIRFAALCIYMVFSPLMFLGMVFPGLQSVSSKYWSGFLGRAFYAPAYLMLVYLAAFVMGSYNSAVTGNDGFRKTFTEQSPSAVANSIGPFVLTCVFLIASVVVAGKLSADGATTVNKLGRNLTGRAQRGLKNGALGTGRFALRNTAGLATSYGVNRAGEASRESLRRRNANLSQSDSRFDRWRARTSERTVGAALDRVATARVAGSETRAERRARVGSEQFALNTADQQFERASRNDQYGRMSNEEVLRLSDAQLRDPAVLAQLTNAHMDAIRDSGRYHNDAFSDINNTRRDAQINQAAEAFDDVNASATDLNQTFSLMAQTLRGMNAESKAQLGVDRLSQERVAVHLSDNDLQQMEQTGRLTPTEMQRIRAARDTARENIAAGTTNYASGNTPTNGNAPDLITFHNDRRRALMQNPQEAGRLPASVFMQPEMMPFITTAALTQRVRNGLDDTDVQNIQTALQNYLMGPATSREAGMWEQWNLHTTEGARFNL